MFAGNIMTTMRTVVGFVQTRVHQKGNTTTGWGYAAANKTAPHIGCIARLLIHNSRYMIFAARTLNLNRKTIILNPK